LSEEKKDEMFRYAVEIIEEDNFLMNINWTKLHEKDRYFNWFHGFTAIKIPFYSSNDGYQNYYIYTSATSGVVTTQYYGEEFQSDLVERRVYYVVRVYPPQNVTSNKNVTLHFKMEKMSMEGLASGYFDVVYIKGLGELDSRQTTVDTSYTPLKEGHYYWIRLTRDVSPDDLETMELGVMPGFRFSWWYSSAGMEVTPQHIYDYQEFEDTTKMKNKQLAR